MPKKYQPDYPYLRKVPIHRVHMFTFFQLGCLVMLWVVKDIKSTSIFFPIMVIKNNIAKSVHYVSYSIIRGRQWRHAILDIFDTPSPHRHDFFSTVVTNPWPLPPPLEDRDVIYGRFLTTLKISLSKISVIENVTSIQRERDRMRKKERMAGREG